MSGNKTQQKSGRVYVLPAICIIILVTLWYFICYFHFFPPYALPSPGDVIKSFGEEIRAGRLFNDVIASLWRIIVGFVISSCLGILSGLFLGQHAWFRNAFSPLLDFFRFLSPLGWIPFAILWFHIGDAPAIFIIFMATFFPLTISTMSAVASIPGIYFRVAREYNYKKSEILAKVIFPAIFPQVITSLRISFGIAWVVIVAAEMVGCQNGLGYGIWEARNGLRLDIAVCYMIVIGIIGISIDLLLLQFKKLPNTRWGYEK